jgi:hypothetical protein
MKDFLATLEAQMKGKQKPSSYTMETGTMAPLPSEHVDKTMNHSDQRQRRRSKKVAFMDPSMSMVAPAAEPNMLVTSSHNHIPSSNSATSRIEPASQEVNATSHPNPSEPAITPIATATTEPEVHVPNTHIAVSISSHDSNLTSSMEKKKHKPPRSSHDQKLIDRTDLNSLTLLITLISPSSSYSLGTFLNR